MADNDEDNNDFDDGSDTLIPLIILTIFIIFMGIMLYLIILSGLPSTQTAEAVELSTDIRSCPVGECATNIFTGYKRCPADETGTITINSAVEVCNPPYACTNDLTPYALLTDGSTDIDGICDPDVKCACLSEPQCPNYIRSIFTTSDGNPFANISTQRISFPQMASYLSDDNVNVIDPPFIYTLGKNFCTIPLSWLPVSNPGCNFIDASQGNSINYNQFLACMNLANGCNGTPANPCLTGTLALISDIPDDLTINDIYTSQYGCVSGENTCECNETPIFDTNSGLINCRDLAKQTPFT